MKFIFCILFLYSYNSQAGDFYEEDGFALAGVDPVSFFETEGPQAGVSSIRTEYKGSIFLFTSETHKNEFLKNPEKFSPQFNGFCAFGMAGGYKAKIETEAYTVVDGKLYLNYDLTVQRKWMQNRDHFIEKAEKNWPHVKSVTKVYQ